MSLTSPTLLERRFHARYCGIAPSALAEDNFRFADNSGVKRRQWCLSVPIWCLLIRSSDAHLMKVSDATKAIAVMPSLIWHPAQVQFFGTPWFTSGRLP